ncbi:glycosyltransferase family 4 protein [Stutzerimonas nitrititolerans]|uniref:glycosyltransferase family 4 protein n=1 Tax=Stutzerimonas nitrititolerans TaxID=2482751 RepID=UPI0028A0FFFD|nr:glycosyltransferase family 4 protein [Stutzerimonas nitrititolerans]
MHMCLSCFYIDGYSYQENEIVAQNVKDGHDVVVLASTETFNDKRELDYLSASSYMGSDGARVIRFDYWKWLPHKIARKIRGFHGIYKQLCAEKPDVVLFHGLCAWELLSLIRYKKNFPDVKIYLDSHEDFNNSARGFVSRFFLHYLFYRTIFRMSLPYVEKVLCISKDTTLFVSDFYGAPDTLLEFFPLGGAVLSDGEYVGRRERAREQLGVKPEDLLFVQTGKMDSVKKIIESLEAFSSVATSANVKFYLAGYLYDDVKERALELIASDDRIVYLGWNSTEDLRSLLCAADVYVQPGSQSATMQMSLCCRCVVMLDDVLSHKPFVTTNGWLLNAEMSLERAFAEAVRSYENRKIFEMSNESHRIAAELLDYKKLSQRILV